LVSVSIDPPDGIDQDCDQDTAKNTDNTDRLQ
jgi:hypothetical protein